MKAEITPALSRFAFILAGLVDTIKDLLGDQFAVTLVLRHKTRPSAHMVFGDDPPEDLVQTLAEIGADETASRYSITPGGIAPGWPEPSTWVPPEVRRLEAGAAEGCAPRGLEDGLRPWRS
jgi:hypothetical protein